MGVYWSGFGVIRMAYPSSVTRGQFNNRAVLQEREEQMESSSRRWRAVGPRRWDYQQPEMWGESDVGPGFSLLAAGGDGNK